MISMVEKNLRRFQNLSSIIRRTRFEVIANFCFTCHNFICEFDNYTIILQGQLREKSGEPIELKFSLHCADPTSERWCELVLVQPIRQHDFDFKLMLSLGFTVILVGSRRRKFSRRKQSLDHSLSVNLKLNLAISFFPFGQIMS